MNHSFICSDCGLAHTEPLEATFVVHVRCSDCFLLLELEEDRATQRDMMDAAA